MRLPALVDQKLEAFYIWAQRVIARYQVDYTALAGSQTLGIVAAGTTQGGATQLAATVNQVVTTPANSGVRLQPQPQVVQPILIANMGVNALKVYPLVGSQINALGANVAFSLGAGKVGIGYYATATQSYFGQLA